MPQSLCKEFVPQGLFHLLVRSIGKGFANAKTGGYQHWTLGLTVSLAEGHIFNWEAEESSKPYRFDLRRLRFERAP